MRIITILVFMTLIITSCSTTKKSANSSGQNLESSTSSTTSSSSTQDGSSYEKAIVIDAKSETDGVKMEYDWLKKNYPGYKLLKQTLGNKEKKWYDIMITKTAEGEEKTFYFDITKFFGKF